MYRGTKPFDREQLVFIVEAALSGAFDVVQGALPMSNPIDGVDLDHWLRSDKLLRQFIWGAAQQVSIFIPILWAQTEGERVGDGMGTGDFEGWDEFEKMVDNYITHNTTRGNVRIDPPDTRPLAEKIVDAHWGDYLKIVHPLDLFEEMKNQGFNPSIFGNSSDQYIEEVPNFETMYQVRKEIDDLIQGMESLIQGHDVVQRATDLDTMAQNLYNSVHRMVTVTD